MVVTVTYDGKVLKPKTSLDLEIDKEYEIELISDYNDHNENISEIKDEQLNKLHQEFDWWIADIGVKQPLRRENCFEQ